MTDTTSNPDYRRLYMEEHAAHLKTKARLQFVENPPRTDEQLQANLASIRTFIESTPTTAGAVTCANLYNAEFFKKEKDTRFVKALCTMLVSYYQSDYALVESEYSRWQSLA